MRKSDVFNICDENLFKLNAEKLMICFNKNILCFLNIKLNIGA